MEKQCFSFKHHDDRIRSRSTSGGAFSAIAETIIRNDGIVYGASLNQDDMTVSHIRIDSIADVDKLRGSKYLQSRMGDIFVQIKNDLKSGNTVLFSGTPCQVAGLRRYLIKEYENLFTCDIICHGVSSPLIWKEFVSAIEREHGTKVINACFRDKEGYQWKNCKETLCIQAPGTGEVEKISADDYAKVFYDHEAMRPSCYCCMYATVNRPGDITLGDFWGIETAHPELYDELGVSFVMKNTEKGDGLLQMLASNGVLKKASLNECRQPQLYKPIRKPSTRNWFWKTYYKKGFEEVIRNNRNSHSLINMRRNLIWKTKQVVKRLVSCMNNTGRKKC